MKPGWERVFQFYVAFAASLGIIQGIMLSVILLKGTGIPVDNGVATWVPITAIIYTVPPLLMLLFKSMVAVRDIWRYRHL